MLGLWNPLSMLIPEDRVTRRFVAVMLTLIGVSRVAWLLGPAALPVRDVASVAVFGVALVAIRIGLRRYQPADRLTWHLVFVDQAVWMISQTVRVFERDVFGHHTTPVADLIGATQYVVIVVIMVRVIRVRIGIDDSVDRAANIDTLVVAAGAVLLYWRFALNGLSIAGLAPVDQVMVLAFPVLDMVVLVLGVRAAIGRGTHTLSLKLITTSLFVLFAADTGFSWQINHGAYHAFNWLDVPYQACVLLVGLAALHPSMTGVTERPTVRPDRLRPIQFAAMFAATALAPVLLMLNSLTDDDKSEFFVAGVGLVMFIGVLGRVRLSANDDAKANFALRSSELKLQLALNSLRATERERAHLLSSVIRAGEKERIWVAAELHDGPIQALSALGFRLDRARRRLAAGDPLAAATVVEESRDDLSRVVDELRKLMSELRPAALDERGIDGALADYVHSFETQTGIECNVRIELTRRVPGDVETTMYRVAQEAMQNVRKHARATRVTLAVSERNGLVVLSVHDNGCGFETGERFDHPAISHYGLIGMRERVEQHGGRWRVRSVIGQGTTIEAEIPVSDTSSEPAYNPEVVAMAAGVGA